MDIFKIRSFIPLTGNLMPRRAEKNMEKDPQGGNASHYERERKLSQEEVERAKELLEDAPSFGKNGLTIEVREQDERFFLDVFDARGRKLKTINPLGILEILRNSSAYPQGANKVSILDRRV